MDNKFNFNKMDKSYQRVINHLEEIKKLINEDKIDSASLKELAFHTAKDMQQYEKSEVVKNDFSKMEEKLKSGDLKMLKSISITGLGIFEDRLKHLDLTENLLAGKTTQPTLEEAKNLKMLANALAESAKGWFGVLEKIENIRNDMTKGNKNIFEKILDSISGLIKKLLP